MRTEFIECKSRNTCKAKCPWFAIVVKVEGGYMAFESMLGYWEWRAYGSRRSPLDWAAKA